jgi:hypothetical protein
LMGAACVLGEQLRKALAVLGGVALLLAVLLPVQLEVSEEADALHAGGLVAAGERLLHGGKDDVVVELVAQVLAQALALGLGQLLDDAGTAGLAADRQQFRAPRGRSRAQSETLGT